LPHHLVASFKATLEEARQARLLLHVVDAGNPAAEEHIKSVNQVLGEIGCGDKRTILVLNKIDTIDDRSRVHLMMALHPKAVAISGATGEGIDELRDAVIESLTADYIDAEVHTDLSNGKVIAYLNAHAEIYHQEFRENEITIRCRLPRHLMHHIEGDGVTVKQLGLS